MASRRPDYEGLRVRILEILARDPFARVREIAQSLGCTNQAVYRAAPPGTLYMRRLPKPSKTGTLHKLAQAAGAFEAPSAGETVRPGKR